MSLGTATDYLENKLLDHSLGTATYTFPSQVYVGLLLDGGPPGEAGGGTEVSTSGTNYARIAINFGAASAGIASNSNACLFTNTGTDFGDIRYYAIYDAISGGNMLYNGGLNVKVTIGDGDSYNLPIGIITIKAY